MKKIIGGLALAISMSVTVSAAETPEGTINDLFDAMRAGDGAAIRALWVNEDAKLARITPEGEYRNNGYTRWADWVDQQEQGDADERIFNVQVDEFGNLATVWAPFKIWYKGDLVGCGVNHFTLIKQEGDWRIAHGIDTQHTGDCNTYGN